MILFICLLTDVFLSYDRNYLPYCCPGWEKALTSVKKKELICWAQNLLTLVPQFSSTLDIAYFGISGLMPQPNFAAWHTVTTFSFWWIVLSMTFVFLTITVLLLVWIWNNQVLVIVAFSNHLSLDRVKLLLSVGPTYFLMMFIKCMF